MSAKSIALYQAHTGRAPSAAEQIKAHADKLRKRGQSQINQGNAALAQANELDELAAWMGCK